MKIDVSGLTFREADKDEKKCFFRLMNLRSFIMTIVAFACFGIATYCLLRTNRFTWLALTCFAIEIILLIWNIIVDMPPWKCKICKGTVMNKREVYPDEESGLYFDAVTFTSENNEVKDELPVFSEKTLNLLKDGSKAVIVCYNKRQPVLFAEEQLHRNRK